jgi:hypothetical protein
MVLGRCRRQPLASGRKRRGDERSCGKHATCEKHVSSDGAGECRRMPYHRRLIDLRGDTIMLRKTVADGLSENDIHHLAQFLTIA